MIQIKRKGQETTLNLLKRFSRRVKQSGNILRFKEAQFKQRSKSNLKKKREALKKIAKKEKIDKLYKLGKLDKERK